MLVPVGQSVGWCVNASGVLGQYPDTRDGKVGVWGKVVKPETVVLEGDRIEVYVACLPEAVAKARKMKAGGIVASRNLGDNNA
jgi:putative ubiquitin-RnfH superfamily antitoxin RatB of RatAB toxin-antitoxin module